MTQNDNIVKLLGVLMEIDNYGLILELMVFGNVVAFIKEYGGMYFMNFFSYHQENMTLGLNLAFIGKEIYTLLFIKQFG